MSGMHNPLRIAIIGCGLIGAKRAKASAGATVSVFSDLDPARAQALAQAHPGARAVGDWREAVADADVDAVVVATPHQALAEVGLAAIEAGKHVLIEKPAARRVAELLPLRAAAERCGVAVRVGYNHRYHRGFQAAHRLVADGALGPLMFVRARYGHGGRPGYDREWRARPELSGGGELIDQGVHLIDLARWFLGDFTEVDGYAHTYFWDMPVDDNAFLLLKTASAQVAHLHASCTEWKNTFSFEIYGRDGKLQIDGLGGSYGTEQLAFYKMLPEMGPPETQIWQYPMADNSWDIEMAEFIADIASGRPPSVNLDDAIAALTVVEAIYERSGYDYSA